MFVSLNKFMDKTPSIILFIIGVPYLFGMLSMTIDTFDFLSKAEKISGKVIQVTEEEYSYSGKHASYFRLYDRLTLKKKNNYTYLPTFAVKSPLGEVFHIPSSYSSFSQIAIGDEVSLYVTFNPPKVIESFLDLWGPLIFGFFCTFSVLFYAWAFW